ncbi:mannose-1-phosphate guanylyltransferase/mannose-6-phosphate isomerase [Methylophaga sp.]|jgi:mannose-1-phosphate guanylyltransferase/mannose-6-phosphate isomerase|uniref:mannose-1-phosphate guanylyltransferase/mannose-6-phosphate isomerase n=1 Tax=Methylophaga sp. TaxID=2024840 RepID=UPI0013FFEBBA|nr:mannose-1-phosphate guanylyltransferase/mannose-6-phosphate isomerase [Methylophaga sp.]MTI62574.1 mannose-1-phosphate guanylyltransferase/mannose-6-phosphate isomerase [Methylophaga sp.]
MIPIVMSGGNGTRLWPLSRKHKPKQFLALFGDRTMFQQTLMRLNGVSELAPPTVVCSNEHRFMVAEQLNEIGVSSATIILEPVGRDTAPALTIAALQAIQEGDDPILLVLAADHIISDIEAFHLAIDTAKVEADKGHLVTFGIVPTDPNTGYGYIEASEKDVVSRVEAFVEKPDLDTAQTYVASGNYYWNSGMFMFKASTLLAELEKYSPDILAACREALNQATPDLDFIRLDQETFEACSAISIDYAVMEKTDNAIVVPLDAGWSDVGSWSSLWECEQQGENNNVTRGDVILDEVSNSYIHSECRLVSVLGLENVVVVETADAVMVASKDKTQDVKNIVQSLNQAGRPEAENHRLCYRPWGYYDSIDNGDRFQVKRISVKPGASLSLQMHHHRAEHWVVVSGTAQVICDEEVTLLTENESTYIPLGKKHRLHNPGQIPLEIIEVQSGSYLGEDDIIRFDDNYHRN